MNRIVVECPGCLSRLRVQESRTTIRFLCPKCGEGIQVDGNGESPAIDHPESELGSSKPSGRSKEIPRSSKEIPRSSEDKSRSRSSRETSSRRPVTQPASSSRDRRQSGGRTPPRSSTPSRVRSQSEFDDLDDFTENTLLEAPNHRKKPANKTVSDFLSQRLKPALIIGLVATASVTMITAGYYVYSKTIGRKDTEVAAAAPETAVAASKDAAVPGEVAAAAAAPDSSSVVSASPVSPVAPTAPEGSSISPVKPNPDADPDAASAGAPAEASKNAVSVNRSERRLIYGWKDGAEHSYNFTIEAGEEETESYRVNGTCSWKVAKESEVPESEGSGTGFVVTSDGVIATCAHVVEGASQIEVVLNGNTYPATVQAVNAKADIALIRISASGLAPVLIQNSDHVQLAESVRVIGFPLSDLLGSDVKVTTGTVAGIVMDPERGKRIQVDAPVNPGNSGGPVVNDAGEVIGVTSAKLSGTTVTSVGFAAPSNDLRDLLAANNIQVPVAARGAQLSGPEVFQKVRPGVCYLKVRGRVGGQAIRLTYNGSFTETSLVSPRRMNRGAFPLPPMLPSFPSHTSDQGSLQVNLLGEVTEYEGTEQLPFVLGPLGLLIIEQFDPYSETQWTHEESTMLKRIKRSEHGRRRMNFAPPIPFGPFGPGSAPEDEVIATIPAVERITWKAGHELNGRLSLTRTSEFTTTDDPQRPYMRIRGTGELVFDLKLGVPQRLECKSTLEVNDEGGHSQIPIKLVYTLRDPEEMKREQEALQQQSRELEEKRKNEKETPNPELVRSLLDQIREAKGDIRASQPLGRLSEIAVVDELRSKVLTVSRKHMKNSNGFVSKSAAEAFAYWATEKELDELIRIIRNKDAMMYTAHQKAVITLSAFDDPQALPPIFEAMGHAFVVATAKDALIRMGSGVEKGVMDHFEEVSDNRIRRELLEVLKEIGTEESEDFLTEVATGEDVSLRSYAQRALDAVRSR